MCVLVWVFFCFDVSVHLTWNEPVLQILGSRHYLANYWEMSNSVCDWYVCVGLDSDGFCLNIKAKCFQKQLVKQNHSWTSQINVNIVLNLVSYFRTQIKETSDADFCRVQLNELLRNKPFAFSFKVQSLHHLCCPQPHQQDKGNKFLIHFSLSRSTFTSNTKKKYLFIFHDVKKF